MTRARDRRWLTALLAVFVAAGLSSAHAQEAPAIDVTTVVSPPAATVGDRLTLTLTARHTDDVIITIDPPHIEHVELVATATPPPLTGVDGRVLTTVEFVLQPFVLGDLDAGAVALRWLRDDGVSGSIPVTLPTLTVLSVRQPGDDALRPLKPQEAILGAPPAWQRPALFGGLAVAAAVVVAAAMVWRRRRQRTPEVVSAPDVSVERGARKRLDRLRGQPLSGDAAFQHYYGEIALVVRAYLEERFGFNASALTTPELEARMTAHGVDRWQARLVSGLLERCDRAVYARHYPDPASADHDLTVAYEIVELSRPTRREEPEAVPA